MKWSEYFPHRLLQVKLLKCEVELMPKDRRKEALKLRKYQLERLWPFYRPGVVNVTNVWMCKGDVWPTCRRWSPPWRRRTGSRSPRRRRRRGTGSRWSTPSSWRKPELEVKLLSRSLIRYNCLSFTITDENVKNWIGVKLGRWACSSWSGIGSLFCSAGGDSKRFWGNVYWARWTRQELPRPPTWKQSFQSQVFQKNWFEEPPNPNLGQAHLPCWAAQLQQPDGHAWGGS